MSSLVDTNILLRSVQPAHPMHPVAIQAVEFLLARGEPLFISIQNVAEFWNSATRPIVYNGLGFTLERARSEVARLEDFFEVLSESKHSYTVWKELLMTHNVGGAQVHDARLVALMKTHRLTTIVTFNVQDFVRYTGITAIHPEKIGQALT